MRALKGTTSVWREQPMLTLKIAGRPPDLHQQGKHRMVKAAITRDRRAMVKVLAQGERHRAGLDPCPDEIRRLHVTLYWIGTKRDSPNVLQDLKADVDALVDAGWLFNDDDNHLLIDYPPSYEVAASKSLMAVEYQLFEEDGWGYQ